MDNNSFDGLVLTDHQNSFCRGIPPVKDLSSWTIPPLKDSSSRITKIASSSASDSLVTSMRRRICVYFTLIDTDMGTCRIGAILLH